MVNCLESRSSQAMTSDMLELAKQLGTITVKSLVTTAKLKNRLVLTLTLHMLINYMNVAVTRIVIGSFYL